METPEARLSSSERLLLHTLSQGNEHEISLDWLALQRLKSFGFVEETQQGPKITAAGRRAIGRPDPRR
jgi:ribosomal protein S19E (S16A)